MLLPLLAIWGTSQLAGSLGSVEIIDGLCEVCMGNRGCSPAIEHLESSLNSLATVVLSFTVWCKSATVYFIVW